METSPYKYVCKWNISGRLKQTDKQTNNQNSWTDWSPLGIKPAQQLFCKALRIRKSILTISPKYYSSCNKTKYIPYRYITRTCIIKVKDIYFLLQEILITSSASQCNWITDKSKYWLHKMTCYFYCMTIFSSNLGQW